MGYTYAKIIDGAIKIIESSTKTLNPSYGGGFLLMNEPCPFVKGIPVEEWWDEYTTRVDGEGNTIISITEPPSETIELLDSNGEATGTVVENPEYHKRGKWVEDVLYIIRANVAKAKATRDQTYEDNIEVFGVTWQIDKVSRDLMDDAISTYQFKVEIGEEVIGSIDWILADNSVRHTTYTELRQVRAEYSIRVKEIFYKYNVWRAGDKLEEFLV